MYILIPVLSRVANFLTISSSVLFNVPFIVLLFLIEAAVNFVDIVPISVIIIVRIRFCASIQSVKYAQV